MNAWEYLMELNQVCFFMSREREGKASNSELKRWCKNQALTIDGVKVKWDQELAFPITTCTLFTKKKTITLL